MKQLLFVCLGLLFSASIASAAPWAKIKTHPTGGCNPPAGGYATVIQVPNGNGGGTLRCDGCSDQPCMADGIDPAVQDMFNYADTQIAAGTMSGSYTNPVNGYTVDWTATDIYDATINVTP